jgi:hypothetical protein
MPQDEIKAVRVPAADNAVWRRQRQQPAGAADRAAGN